MSALQMDPAPAAEPNKHEPKVWLGGGTFGVPHQDTEPFGSDAEMGDGEPFDENNMFVSISKKQVPPCFFEREAYCTLSKQGLCDLPECGDFKLSYHSVSCQWHAMWGSSNYAPSWGKIRSEIKALLLVLIRIWKEHVSTLAEQDAAPAKEYLHRLESYSEDISF